MDSRVQVTTNAGSGAWARWTNASGGLPLRAVTHIAVDPNTATTAYVTFSGFTGFGDTSGHIFKTTDGGSAWTDISSDLPNTPVDALVIDPDAPSTLFAGTDIGVFYTTDGGTSWTSLVTGLPRIAVLGLTLHERSRTLLASTHGRSAWNLNLASLSSPTPTPTPTTGPALMVSPAAGSTFTSSTVTFQWTAGSATAYILTLGSAAKGIDIYSSGLITSLSAVVHNIPTDGRTVFATLYSRVNNVWVNNAYTYEASNGAPTPTPTPTPTATPTPTPTTGPAVMLSPPPGSTFSSSSVTFNWSAGSATQYVLLVGSSLHGSDIYNSSIVHTLSATVNNMPADGRTIYVTLTSQVNGSWITNSYTYTAK